MPFGAIFIDGAKTILSMNAAAEAILARPACALSARRGRLSASNPPRSGVLEQTVAQVCTLIEGVMPSPGGDLIVSVPEGGSDLLQSIGSLMHAPVYGLPATPCAAVFVRDLMPTPPRGFEEHIQQMFALAPKEAAIVAGLATGQRLKDIAAHERYHARHRALLSAQHLPQDQHQAAESPGVASQEHAADHQPRFATSRTPI